MSTTATNMCKVAHTVPFLSLFFLVSLTYYVYKTYHRPAWRVYVDGHSAYPGKASRRRRGSAAMHAV
jgi:hypothetical protein